MAGIVGTITNLSDFLSKTQVCLSVKPNDPQQQIICLEADRKYSIPAFQREVRWDDNNLKMLLYDLSRSSKFLGNIILTIKSDHTCEIIDGQQRTTVLMLIVSCIKKKFGTKISTPDLCPLRNEGFTGFQTLLEKAFDQEAITSDDWNAILKSDDYHQLPRIQKLWNTISSSELLADRHKAQGLFDNLCKSEFNIIASYSNDVNTSIQYFLDVNLKGIRKTNEEKLIKAGGEKARELQERIEELIRLISIARDELERIESKDENDASLTEENNLHKADQKFKYYEQEIAKATRTNTALRKKELVDSLVNEIKLQATTALKQEIVRKTNEKLRRVIVDDYVEIESIDRYIKLKGRDGASEGQTLSIAYCFLGTLFEDSELEFPFIIDSPTGKMDFEKRQAVADIIPLVFNQMIAFVQSAEVERFADRFYANPDSQYLTVVASPQDQAVVVYEGIDFFDSYQREHKGDEK